MAVRNNSRSPLRDEPLRQAGQSVEEERQRILDEVATPYIVASFFVILLAVFEWYRWWATVPVQPGTATVVAAAVVGYSLFKLRHIARRNRELALGRKGEQIVGESLEQLRATGCLVFHDLVADRFNVDHVVLSDRGVFVIETKTFSKPFPDAKVRSDGQGLSCDGLGDKREIVDQAKGNAKWVAEMLRESTGKDYATKPVIAFPGWWVEGGLHKDHWVVNPKALPKLIEGEDQRIPMEDVRLGAFHLSRYIRSTSKWVDK